MHLFPLPYSKFVLYQTSPIRAGLFSISGSGAGGSFKTGRANSISVNGGLKKFFARGFALLRSIWALIRGRIKNSLTACLYCGLPKEMQRCIGDDYADMYKPGAKITSLNELAEQEHIFWKQGNNNRLYHRGWFMSWQLRYVELYIRWGYLYYAVKEDNHDGK